MSFATAQPPRADDETFVTKPSSADSQVEGSLSPSADVLPHISLKRALADTDSGGSSNGSISLPPTEPSTTPSDTASQSNKKLKRRSKHLQLPHPFCIKPLGNAFLSDRNDRRVTFGLMTRLDDDLIMHILSLVAEDMATLTRLEATSHGFHAYINANNMLWRDAFLETFDSKLKRWCGSWKRTFAWHNKFSKLVGDGRVSEQYDGSNLVLLEPPMPPVRSPYLFSDSLFHPFRLSMAPIDHLLAPEVDHLPIGHVDASKPGSLEAFRDNYACANLPAIIEGAMSVKDWPCRQWSLESLASRWPNRFFQCEAVRCRLPAYLSYAKSMQELVDQAHRDDDDDDEPDQKLASGTLSSNGSGDQKQLHQQPRSKAGSVSSGTSEDGSDVTFDPHAIPDESPFYLFDATFADDPHASLEWRVPKIFHQISATSPDASGDHAGVRSDLFSLLGPRRPDHRWIIAGPKRSGSGWHKDPNGTSAWNAVLTGRKAWMMLPPHITPPGVYVSEDEAEVTAPVSIAEWLIGFAQETRKLYGPSAARSEDRVLLEGVCEAGEVLYVPSGWWHLVVNLEESVALTQNFVSPPEIGIVLDFMKNKADQLSGFKKSQTAGNAPACMLAPGRMPNTLPQSSRSNSNEDEEEECEGGAGFGVFELFCERLGRFDKELLEAGLAKMQEIEQKRQAGMGSRGMTSRLTKLRGKAGAGDEAGDGSKVATWWERLKAGEMPESDQDADEADKPAAEEGTFSLLSQLVDEELEEVPW